MSWLWRSDTSAASYEKALSKLSTQIGAATSSLEKTRSRGRRAKGLWTLYISLGYLLSILILVLIIGPQNWGVPHYGGLVGTPLLIFGVRRAITSAFGWQLSRQQTHLDRLQKQREEKISDLKKATRYDSTQEILQKYGAPSPKPTEAQNKSEKKQGTKDQKPSPYVQRTGIAPPPTANIAGRNRAVTSPSNGPPPQIAAPTSPMLSHQTLQQSPVEVEEPGFAPNAFSQPSQAFANSRTFSEPKAHWYDRILDVMLGEDETLAKNRMVLLCQNCRMVNGQAPPGVKTLEELGRWRCQSCGAWNGVQNEVAKVVQEMAETHPDANLITPSKVNSSTEQDTTEGHEGEIVDEQSSPTGTDLHFEPSTITKRVTRSAGISDLDAL